MAAISREIDVALLRDALSYDPDTGVFIWGFIPEHTNHDKIRNSNFAGRQAGSIRRPQGYRQIKLGDQIHFAHRLAWAYVYGETPTRHIDHINGNPDDNRICNLRLATVSQNGANSKIKATNTSGYKGVSWRPHAQLWCARIQRRHLGYFRTAEAAAAAYDSAAKRTFGQFAAPNGSSR